MFTDVNVTVAGVIVIVILILRLTTEEKMRRNATPVLVLYSYHHKILTSSSFIPIPPIKVAYRWIVVVLDILYIFMMIGQKKTGRLPSKRFDETRSYIIVHLISGIILIYSGVCLQLADVFSKTLKEGHPFYFVTAASGLVHSITVAIISPKVMGERRITFPLYVCAGLVNFVNSIILILYPDIKHAFLLWGSVNTFIFVRLHIVLFMFSNIDWELAYTYPIIAAAAVSYPMSGQGHWVYLFPIAPLVYGPFHERVCHCMGWETEDFLDGNKPAKKNVYVYGSTAKLRVSLHLSDRNRSRSTDKNELMRADEDDARDGAGAGNSNPVAAAAHMSERTSK